MKRILLSLMLVVLSSLCFAQKQKVSVVELQNGSVIRGVLLESTEGTVKIQTADQSVFVYTESEIVQINEANNDSNRIKLENNLIISGVYAMNLLGFNVPNYGEITLGYYMDINMPNTILYFEVGATLAYSYRYKENNWKLHSPYVGLPLGIGFHINMSNGMRINPFFRLTPLVCKYIGENYYYGKNSYTNTTCFGGVAPEIGATLNLTNHIVITSSIAMMWDTDWWDYSRCGQIGLNIGAGYRF